MMKKKKIWRNSNENFAKMHEGRKKKNPIRGKMMDLNPIGSKKLKQEIEQGITEPGPHKRNKKNRLIRSGRRDIVLTRTREIRETFLLKKAMSNKKIQLRLRSRWLGELPLHFPHRNKFGVLDHLERRLLVDRFALILALVLRHHLRKTKTRFGRK